MMVLWREWLRRVTPPATVTAAVGEKIILDLSLKLNNLFSSVGHFARDCPTFTGVRRDAMVIIFCVCNLMLNESWSSQVEADPFEEVDSLEEIIRALPSATDATSLFPPSPIYPYSLFYAQNGTLCQRVP
jgi:hypothetical protein